MTTEIVIDVVGYALMKGLFTLLGILLAATLVAKATRYLNRVKDEKEEFYWDIERVLAKKVLEDCEIDLEAELAKEEKHEPEKIVTNVEQGIKKKVGKKFFTKENKKEK